MVEPSLQNGCGLMHWTSPAQPKSHVPTALEATVLVGSLSTQVTPVDCCVHAGAGKRHLLLPSYVFDVAREV